MNKSKEKFNLVVKTFFGAEDLLVEELKNLGAINPVKATRAVMFEGDQRLMYAANLWCRTALRILKPFKTFPAANEQQLYDEVQKINWEELFSLNDTFSIDAVANKSYFTHTQFVAQKIKDAIVDQFRNKYGKRPFVDTAHPTLRINAHISEDVCTLSLDSSGESLHKRGYRNEANEAPVNEALAAGLIMLSGWKGQEDFVDFMCGSGTILIEAGLIARNIPPGMFRSEFGFEKWADFDNDLWNEVLDEAQDKEIRRPDCRIYGCDISSFTNKIARQNVINARMEGVIEVEAMPFHQFKPASEKGTVIINPPYGGRLDDGDIEALYKAIGDHLKNNFRGWSAWILTANKDAAKRIGLHPSRKIPLFNGALECRFLKYELYEGSKKAKSLKSEV